nr:hypothetical protein [Cronobacter muytjensii]
MDALITHYRLNYLRLLFPAFIFPQSYSHFLTGFLCDAGSGTIYLPAIFYYRIREAVYVARINGSRETGIVKEFM